jgi:hypothetical protein
MHTFENPILLPIEAILPARSIPGIHKGTSPAHIGVRTALSIVLGTQTVYDALSRGIQNLCDPSVSV